MAVSRRSSTARRRPGARAPRKDASPAVQAWFDGACEPINPGGLGTYGFVVRQGGHLLVRRHGVVPDIDGVPMTGNIAEYVALLLLLEWLAADANALAVVAAGASLRIEGDSKLVVMQVRGEWDANVPVLRLLRDKCRALLPAHARLVHVARKDNAEADALTHLAYVEAFEADGRLAKRYAPHLASAYQVRRCKAAGVPTYAFMGAREAERLLAKARVGR